MIGVPVFFYKKVFPSHHDAIVNVINHMEYKHLYRVFPSVPLDADSEFARDTYGFLFLGYRPRAYGWELVMFARKGLLTIIEVVFAAVPMLQQTKHKPLSLTHIYIIHTQMFCIFTYILLDYSLFCSCFCFRVCLLLVMFCTSSLFK